MQNPQGNPLSITAPPQLAQSPLNPAETLRHKEPEELHKPPSSEFSGAALPASACACAFLPGCPSLPVWGGFFPLGFLFPLRTPRVCVALSPRHNAPLHFLGRGLARASDLSGAKSQGSRVTRGHRGQTKSLQPLM